MEEGDRYGVEWEVVGTNDGPIPLLGLPASGRTFTIRAGAFGQIEGGRIKRHREYWDVAGLLAQLGIPPFSAGPVRTGRHGRTGIAHHRRRVGIGGGAGLRVAGSAPVDSVERSERRRGRPPCRDPGSGRTSPPRAAPHEATCVLGSTPGTTRRTSARPRATPADEVGIRIEKCLAISDAAAAGVPGSRVRACKISCSGEWAAVGPYLPLPYSLVCRTSTKALPTSTGVMF